MKQPLAISPAAWAAIFLLAGLWGGSFLTIRIALDEIPVATLVAFRVGGAALALWAVVLALRLPLPRDPRQWGALLVMGLLNNIVPFSLISWGEQHIASGLAAILNASTAIIGVLVAAALLPDERLTTRKLAGVALGFAGVAVATGLANLTSLDPRSLGQLALIGSSTAYALAGVWARVTLKGIPPLVASAGMTGASTLMIVPFALWHDGAPALTHSAPVWAAVAWLSLVATALAYLLYYRILALAGSANLMVTTLLVAPIGILLGALVLGERLDPAAYAGFALLATGLIVLDGRVARRLRTLQTRRAG